MVGALTLSFLVAFFVLRQRSAFLAIERDGPAAAAVAAAHGLSLAEAFALRDLVACTAPVPAWHAAAAEFAALRLRLGDGLAAVAIAGERDAAEAARAAAASADAAWHGFRTDARALPGVRFLDLRQRFAARIAARD
ncbi:MAG: hypothetical protein KF830_04215 [Planctomycetes bacterium]|nr:hypothetical protein [Planctomycetota bacterium]